MRYPESQSEYKENLCGWMKNSDGLKTQTETHKCPEGLLKAEGNETNKEPVSQRAV